jgi:hypothetical protein
VDLDDDFALSGHGVRELCDYCVWLSNGRSALVREVWYFRLTRLVQTTISMVFGSGRMIYMMASAMTKVLDVLEGSYQ